VLVLDEEAAKRLAAGLAGRTAQVRTVERRSSRPPEAAVHNLHHAAEAGRKLA